MRKKKRILIAGLMAISITGASSLAYFTDTTSVMGNSGDNNILELNITNGNVSITGQIGNGGATPNWTYDVARYSTSGYNAIPEIVSGGSYILAGVNYPNFSNKNTIISSYENTNRSPDIILDGSSNTIYSTTNRAEIGAAVTGNIAHARPGDAFVLGQAAPGGSQENSGLKIINSSTLTTKVLIRLKSISGDDGDGAYSMYKSLKNAGWRLYINGSIVTDEISNTDTETGGSKENLNNNIASAMSSVTNLKGGDEAIVQIRVELPLLTGNEHQNGASAGYTVNNFNIQNLFEIIATQENNPGWKQDGATY